MIRSQSLSPVELDQLDRFFREGGLRQMASPHVHYHEPNCPHPGCAQKMEWIDFQLELHGHPEAIYKPLVRAWWEGRGFAGRCPACSGWIRFTTLRMDAPTVEIGHLADPQHQDGDGFTERRRGRSLPEAEANQYPRLPENWHAIAQVA